MMSQPLSRPGREQGLTMLELAFVMLVVGILASTLVPMLSDTHHKSMAEEDRRIVKNLKEVLIGQFLATGRLPECKNAAGVASSGNCDIVRSLEGLPVRLQDSRNQPIKYDVWNVPDTGDPAIDSSLTSPAANKTNICTRLDNAIAAPYAPGQLAQCAGVPDYDDNTTWASYCGTPQNVAFVLVATGVNRDGQANEIAASTPARPGNRNIGNDRVFERPERRHVGILPGSNTTVNYDDIVEVVTLQELKARCPL
ncbi:MAG: type II secretion system GspH family protein [Azovibrio sp.]|nr:type II secretion system GspH family protein [Azovibrio sp.]